MHYSQRTLTETIKSHFLHPHLVSRFKTEFQERSLLRYILEAFIVEILIGSTLYHHCWFDTGVAAGDS